jgi:hypothetical protein
MKVITLTADQKTKLATLTADMRTSAAAAGAANKAYKDYVATITGLSFNPASRAEVSDDGNSLVIG